MFSNKMPNACATIYEGELDLTFSCVGATVCKFALCSLMPVDGTEECTFMEYGTCLCPVAKQTTIELLIKGLKKELQKFEDE